jgi:hypothetical protein
VFRGLVDAVWSSIRADVVFLFAKPFDRDDLNREAVLKGYKALAAADPEHAVSVPADSPETTTEFILDELVRRSLVSRW